MSRSVVDAELEVTEPDGSSRVTVPGSDIEVLEIQEAAQEMMDSGTIDIANHDRSYTGSDRITAGDKLVFRTQLQGESSLSDHWTAIARTVTDVLDGGSLQRLQAEATDFVFTVLDWRLVYDTFDDVEISGASDSILNTLIDDEASEIGTSQIASITDTTDAFYNGRKLLDIVRDDLAPIADALAYQDGTDLVFEKIGNINAKHDLDSSDFEGPIEVPSIDDRIANLVRVDGGTDFAIDNEQTTQTSTTTVTDSNRITYQIQARKSEYARIEIYTKTTGSGDNVVVRLQADRGGSPVDASDRSSDISRNTLASNFLANDGFTTFIMPAHELAPNSDPWLIIESDGSTGQDIGVDSNGDPAYKARYPFPLLARNPNQSSQDEYRRRDHRIKDDSIDSESGVRDKAQSYARHNNEPEKKLIGEASTVRAHNLSPGQGVDMTGWSTVDTSGKWICRQRTEAYDGSRNELTTELTLQEADTV